jgi:GMP synthase-like glutamine amidotransferase
MRIGILKTDQVRPEFAAEFGEYPDMFAALLERVDPALGFVTYDVTRDEYPQSIDEVDAYLITGSRYGVYDDEAWIAPLEAFVRRLVEVGKPLIGVCFGHQLVAQALGGSAGKSSRGWGVGVQTWAIGNRPDWMRGGDDHFRLLASHQDQVETLPPGATLLAGSAFCPVAMYQVGDSVLALQGHPEFVKGYSRGLLELRRDRIGEATYAAGVESLQQQTDEVLVARWMLDFLRRALPAYDARQYS